LSATDRPVVAVLKGGRSSEHEISLLSGRAVAAGLEDAGFQVEEITVGRDGSWNGPEGEISLLPGHGIAGVDVVFPALHGPFGEDGSVQGALETVGVPYVGSDVLASATCMDKLTLKRLCRSQGIAQVDFVEAGPEGWLEKALALEGPLWVKPSRLGSSVGITRVEGGEDELIAAAKAAAEHDPRVIVEANSGGREIEVSVLGNRDPEVSVPGEILIDSDWYDFESKYSQGGMRLEAPADLPLEVVSRLGEVAVEVFVLAGCSGMARCDFFVEEDGRVLVNEINTIPGFTDMSVYARLWEATGLSYGDLLERLIDLAIERAAESGTHSF
jgi:D-alanine-D-alanine ligase